MELSAKHGQPGNDAMREMHAIHREPTPIIGAHQSHNQHAGHSVAMFRDKFWLSLALTLPVVFWSAGVQQWLGYRAPAFPGSQFVPAILGSIIFMYGGVVFIRGAVREFSGRLPGMMTLSVWLSLSPLAPLSLRPSAFSRLTFGGSSQC